MRKILYLIVASISLTSCWVEEYGALSKTYYANENYCDIESVLKYTTLIVNDAEKIDMWSKATEQEKKLIEDAYFSDYKINQKGNIITLTLLSEYGNSSNNRLYNTGGKGLYDADSHWTIATLIDTLDLKRIGIEQLKLTSRGDITTNINYRISSISNLDLIFTKSEFEKQFYIKGAGNVNYIPYRSTNTNYSIVSDIIVSIGSNQNRNYISVYVEKGEVEFSWENREDKAQAKITSRNRYIISYKGFTDNWPRIMRE